MEASLPFTNNINSIHFIMYFVVIAVSSQLCQ